MNANIVKYLFIGLVVSGCGRPVNLTFRGNRVGGNTSSLAGGSSVGARSMGDLDSAQQAFVTLGMNKNGASGAVTEEELANADTDGNANNNLTEKVEASAESNSSYNAHFTLPVVIEIAELFGGDTVEWQDPNILTMMGHDLVTISGSDLAKLTLKYKKNKETKVWELVEPGAGDFHEGLANYDPMTGKFADGSAHVYLDGDKKGQAVSIVGADGNPVAFPYTQDYLNSKNKQYFQANDVAGFLESVLNANANTKLDALLSATEETDKTKYLVADYLTMGKKEVRDLLKKYLEFVTNKDQSTNDKAEEYSISTTIEKIKDALSKK